MVQDRSRSVPIENNSEITYSLTGAIVEGPGENVYVQERSIMNDQNARTRTAGSNSMSKDGVTSVSRRVRSN